MSKPNKKEYDEYIKKVQEMRAGKKDDDGDKRSKVRAQGYSAARQGKIYPRELQNTADDSWEDAKIYDRNTRQGQNYAQRHMKEYGETLANRRKKNSKTSTDALLRNKKW